MSKSSLAVDERFMRRALELARKGVGFTSPNPCVGAVLVRSGQVLGEGWHRKAGTPHAEVLAVRSARRAGYSLQGSTLYVTLEPCCTHGRTPPCVGLILEQGIARVVVAATDPNPAHRGKAFRLLRKAGIAVTSGILEKEATELNKAFNHWIVRHRPWVIGKMALSLDGCISPQQGDDRWLTGKAARTLAHHLRAEADAILVGGETARKDNPALTVRLASHRKKLQPWRVVWTRSRRLPKTLTLFSDPFRERTLITSAPDFATICRELGERGVTCLLIEGGAKVLGAALAEGLVNEVAFFLSPHLLGTSHEAVAAVLPLHRGELIEPEYRVVGKDLFCRAKIRVFHEKLLR